MAATAPSFQRPGLGLPSTIPVDIQRAFRTLHSYIGELHAKMESQAAELEKRVGADRGSLMKVAQFVRTQLQATGEYPLSVAQLPGAGTGTTSKPQTSAVESTTVEALGDVRETASDVLQITGGAGAVVGDGVQIEVLKASATQDGYLAKADFATFAAGAGARAQVGVSTALPTGLGVADTGALFFASDTEVLFVWNGSLWRQVVGGAIYVIPTWDGPTNHWDDVGEDWG